MTKDVKSAKQKLDEEREKLEDETHEKIAKKIAMNGPNPESEYLK